MEKIQTGFVKGQSDNLPKVDAIMVAEFFMNNECFNTAEMRGWKMQRSANEKYGDAAVGYVQLKRDVTKCIIRCKITPEHRIRCKAYNVEVVMNEKDGKVISVTCFDCAASEGGCKHGIAVLMWLHRRSEEPAPTEVTCYWQKSSLSKVITKKQFIKASDFGTNVPLAPVNNADGFYQRIIENGFKLGCVGPIFCHTSQIPPLYKLSLHVLIIEYNKTQVNGTLDGFLDYVKLYITPTLCLKAAKETIKQVDNVLWHELRYARITASKLYNIMHTKQPHKLVEQLMGVTKVPVTDAMERGIRLEKEVCEVVKKKVGIDFKPAGFMILHEHPYIGASPDGLSKDFTLEIKCPSSEKTKCNYIKQNGEITARYNAQVQAQMLAYQKRKALFCVADENFENTKQVQCVTVHYDEQYVKTLIESTADFWKAHVFPLLLKNIKL